MYDTFINNNEMLINISDWRMGTELIFTLIMIKKSTISIMYFFIYFRGAMALPNTGELLNSISQFDVCQEWWRGEGFPLSHINFRILFGTKIGEGEHPRVTFFRMCVSRTHYF